MAPHEDRNRPPPEARASAWSAFLNKERTLLILALMRDGLERADAEDAVQEALLADIHHRQKNGPFDSEEGEHHWLRAVEHHKGADVQRRRLKHPTQSLEDFPAEEWEDTAAARPDGEDEAGQLEWAAWLREQLDQEDARNVQLFLARWVERRSLAELAEQTGLTPQGIHARIYRLRKKICRKASKRMAEGEAGP